MIFFWPSTRAALLKEICIQTASALHGSRSTRRSANRYWTTPYKLSYQRQIYSTHSATTGQWPPTELMCVSIRATTIAVSPSPWPTVSNPAKASTRDNRHRKMRWNDFDMCWPIEYIPQILRYKNSFLKIISLPLSWKAKAFHDILILRRSVMRIL